MSRSAVMSVAAGGHQEFLWPTEVFFDEIDAGHVLHNARFAVHVERAVGALYRFQRVPEADALNLVRRFEIDFLAPVRLGEELTIAVWVSHLGRTSAAHGFEFRTPQGVSARGRRLIVKIDVASFRPVPFSEVFRAGCAPLMPDAPA